jgi:enoyl-[acyl-carrier protein] reductase II
LETKLTRLLGVKYPIVQGGMVWAANSDLVAAVSNAGGLGLLGSASMWPDHLREEIRRVKSLTDQNFGVNISLRRENLQTLLEIVMEEGVKAVSCSLGSPKTYVPLLHEHGIVCMHVVTNLKHALKAQEAGADAVIAVGIEAGGHPGPDELACMTLIPQLADHLTIPIVASGGIVDGRGFASAMALGASGVQIGTRFLATTEASVHEAYKQKIVDAGQTDTLLVAKRVGIVRMLKNNFSLKLKEAEENGASADEINGLLLEQRPKGAMKEGDVENGQIQAGQGVGLINDIVPAGEVVQRIISQYEAIKQSMP